MRLDEQLALYTVFHQGRANRIIHGVTVPLIMLSGLVLLAPLGVLLPEAGPLGRLLPLNLGLAIIVAGVGAFAFLDLVAALAVGAWLFPAVFVANEIASRVGLPMLVAVNGAIQGVAWFLTVQIGHGRFEPTVVTADRAGGAPVEVSSNLYFERGYFVLRNVGRPVTWLEAFQQFAIGPLGVTLDVLFAFGYRPQLKADIHALVRTYASRLARGEAILGNEERSSFGLLIASDPEG
jgi:uncharacterized membrane protein YGL010W